MKKLIVFSALALLIFATVGCEKNKEEKESCTNYTQQEKSKKYEWLIGSFGDEEGAGIIKQAQHFKVSKIIRDKGAYYYQPKDRFVGSDSVKIEVSEGSDGGSRGHTTLYKIKFDITKCGMKVSRTKITE